MTFMLIVLGGSVTCVLILTLVVYICEVVENARFNRFKSIPEIKEKYKDLDIAFDRFSALRRSCAELRKEADELSDQVKYLPRNQKEFVKEELDECLARYQSILKASTKAEQELNDLQYNLDNLYDDWRLSNGYKLRQRFN